MRSEYKIVILFFVLFPFSFYLMLQEIQNSHFILFFVLFPFSFYLMLQEILQENKFSFIQK